jgi:hypothetical protein
LSANEKARRLVPEAARKAGSPPLVVLLHGSGRDGKSPVEKWEPLARKEGLVIVGPDALSSELFPVIIRLLLTGALAITTAVGAAAQDVRPGYYTVGSFSGSSMGDDAAIWEARLQGIGAVYVGGLNPAVELVVRQKASDAAPVVAYLGTVEQGGGHRPRHERVQRQPRSEGGAPHTGMGAST